MPTSVARGPELEIEIPSEIQVAAPSQCPPGMTIFTVHWSKDGGMSAPFGRRITEPLDADAAGQATFYCCFDKIGCEEGERDGHIDLSNAALLASAKLCDRGHST
jgi:hypothetical protein